MQPVHILSNQPKVRAASLQFDDGSVSIVRLFCREQPASPVVPLPHEARIPLESFGCRQVLRAKVLPQAVRTAKRRHTAVGGDPGAGEDGDTPGSSEVLFHNPEIGTGRHDVVDLSMAAVSPRNRHAIVRPFHRQP